MTLVWLLWSEDDSPVAAFASRESAEAAAMALCRTEVDRRAMGRGKAHPIERNDHLDCTSFWVGGSNTATVGSMEVQP